MGIAHLPQIYIQISGFRWRREHLYGHNMYLVREIVCLPGWVCVCGGGGGREKEKEV